MEYSCNIETFINSQLVNHPQNKKSMIETSNSKAVVTYEFTEEIIGFSIWKCTRQSYMRKGTQWKGRKCLYKE
jgi:hypothetical protein